jgi:ParB family transcriptional regulator, chromosome partitioning protein
MSEQPIERIRISEIHIANPRPRNRARWQMIVANIREVGLKKTVTLVRRTTPSSDGRVFDLICGQGRVEAFIALGETHKGAWRSAGETFATPRDCTIC